MTDPIWIIPLFFGLLGMSIAVVVLIVDHRQAKKREGDRYGR